MPISTPFQTDLAFLTEPAPEAADTDFFELFRPDDLLTPVGTYATLQEAVDAALDGDRINVLPGAPSGGTVSIELFDLTIRADAPYTTSLVLVRDSHTNRFSLTLEGTANLTTTATQLALRQVINGNDGNDTFLSPSGYAYYLSNTYAGDGGDDTIHDSSRGDTIYGSIGPDTIHGSSGRDTIYGRTGNDVLYGHGGNDVIEGGEGNDTIDAGEGDDTLRGDAGNDVIDGGAGGRDVITFQDAITDIVVNLNHGMSHAISSQFGIDTLVNIEEIESGNHNDILVGNSERNHIRGHAGNDEIYALAGADTIYGGEGDDLIEGSSGDDWLYGDTAAYYDIGTDTLSYYHAAGGVTVNLGRSGYFQDVGGGMGVDYFLGFENLFGSQYYDDTLIGNSGVNLLVGFGGHDVLYGAPGDDTLYGMRGADTLVGGSGADSLGGGGGYDVFEFNATGESTTGARDTILDFDPGTDLIQLSGIDADTTQAGDQAFTFVGSAGFSAAGQLRFATNGTDGFLLGDVNGDGTHDIEIRLLGVTSMSASDFIL